MYRIINIVGLIVVIGLISACGDEAYTTTNNTVNPPDPTNPIDPNPSKPGTSNASSVSITANSTFMGTSSSSSLSISALVMDSSNNALSGETVKFSANGGVLQVDNDGLTSITGEATAKLKIAGDHSNRLITVTASSGNNTTDSIEITASGTSLSISGDDALVIVERCYSYRL